MCLECCAFHGNTMTIVVCGVFRLLSVEIGNWNSDRKVLVW